MMHRLFMVLLFAPFAGSLWAVEMPVPASTVVAGGTPSSGYYRVYPSGLSVYKIEAMRALVSPAMRDEAAHYSLDLRVQELICLARALDALTYDGFRLVRIRGALVCDGQIDASAVERTTYYFNVTPAEAYAWLLASRLMQMSHFKDDGVALMAVEGELYDTASDLAARLRTYFGDAGVAYFMPRFTYGGSIGMRYDAPVEGMLYREDLRVNSPRTFTEPKPRRHKFLGIF